MVVAAAASIASVIGKSNRINEAFDMLMKCVFVQILCNAHPMRSRDINPAYARSAGCDELRNMHRKE